MAFEDNGRTWFRNSYGSITDGRGWEIFKDSDDALADVDQRCPDCLAHPGWSSADESRRREPADVCRTCLGSGVQHRPWSLWHHGEYVNNYATPEKARADANPLDCSKCADLAPTDPYRCACTHLRTWHHARDKSGEFVGVNLGSCVACDCDRFHH